MRVRSMSFVFVVVFSIVCMMSAGVQAGDAPKYVFMFIGGVVSWQS